VEPHDEARGGAPPPMQITIESVKPEALRTGPRPAPKGRETEGVKLAQRGEKTYLVQRPGE